MNARGAAILTNPHPCGHIIYPYTDENLVGQAVCLFASAGLRNGEGVVLIMTGAHCEPIKLRLQIEGFNVEHYERSGQLRCVTTVSQLRTRDLTVTTRMEELWNEVIDKHSVSLLCTYALHNEQDHVPQSLIALHSGNIERE